MKCEECLLLVEDHLDGELDGQTSDLMTEHLKACASCASEHRRLVREQEFYLRYECDAQEAPAFWDNVMARAVAHESKITRSHQALSERLASFRGWFRVHFSAPRFSPSLTALMVLIAVGITAVVMSYFNTREKSTEQPSVSQSTSAPPTLPSQAPVVLDGSQAKTNEDEAASADDNKPGVTGRAELAENNTGRENRYAPKAKREMPAQLARKSMSAERRLTPDSLLREAEQKYVAAINLLSRDLNRRRSQLDAQTAAQFERTLMAVDRTIADTRRAARKHPNDPVAARYMLTAYAKKVDVLREMIGY